MYISSVVATKAVLRRLVHATASVLGSCGHAWTEHTSRRAGYEAQVWCLETICGQHPRAVGVEKSGPCMYSVHSASVDLASRHPSHLAATE
jgi:hypothetical protein